ncbi:MAG: VanZ family protein [Bacteroidota bacterium]
MFSIALLSSFLIEFTQFVLAIGVADIDDIIWNISGTVIGIMLLKFAMIYRLKKVNS